MMILSLILLFAEPAIASGDQEMFQPQCELTERLNSLGDSVIDVTKEVNNSK